MDFEETIYKRDPEAKKLAGQSKGAAKLIFNGNEIPISDRFKIGREAGNDLIIPDDPLVSREHLQISKRANCFFIKDLGSTNGTYVNDKPLKPNKETPLYDNSFIMVGNSKLIFHIS